MMIDVDDMTRYGWWHEDVDGGADKVIQKVFDDCCDYDAGEQVVWNGCRIAYAPVDGYDGDAGGKQVAM